MMFQGSRAQRFYELLRAAAENAVATAERLNELLTEPTRCAELSPLIKELESRGDQVTRDLFALLHKSSATPLERDDLADLAVGLDSVVDAMEAAASRISIYQVKESNRFLKAFGQILRSEASELVAAIDMVAGKKLLLIRERAAQVSLLEKQGDETLRSGLTELYQRAAADPIRFVTTKELYELLEDATDRVHHVLVTLEGIAMKHA